MDVRQLRRKAVGGELHSGSSAELVILVSDLGDLVLQRRGEREADDAALWAAVADEFDRGRVVERGRGRLGGGVRV